jgi:DNA-binding winged helix-turn-helix (wHTH) protein
VEYRFGTIRLDPDARGIAKDGRAVHLTRKAFDLLFLLLEAKPNAVTKDQIYARIWPDAFVTESSLQTLVREIRQALDEPHSRQSWIRTIHGIGYSFAGEAVVSDTRAQAMGPDSPVAWLMGESLRVPLHAGENILGRGLEDGIEINLPTVSRRHARITLADAIVLEDLGSKNGTWLENERLTAPRELSDGAAVRLGSAEFTFRLCRSAGSTESIEMLPPASDLRHRRP